MTGIKSSIGSHGCIAIHLGQLAKWPNASDCKSDDSVFGGSNPSLPTTRLTSFARGLRPKKKRGECPELVEGPYLSKFGAMNFYFYFARCADDSLYAGYCKDIQAREAKHNAGEGAKYTRSRKPVKIIYSEPFETRTDAMRREAQVKKWTRIKKENLIRFGHPLGIDV